MYADIDSAGKYSDKTNTIKVSDEYIGNVETIASIIAHETVHTYAEGTKSIYEETVAYQFMYEVEKRLGISDMGWQKDVVGDIDLKNRWYFSSSLRKDLDTAKATWHHAEKYLNVNALLPSLGVFLRLSAKIVSPYISN